MEETTTPDSTSDVNSSSTSDNQPIKKKRGNPNFKKGQRNTYYSNNNTNSAKTTTKMSDSVTEDISDSSIPNNIFSDTIPEAEVLPLDGEVKTKDYAALKENTSDNNNSGGGSADNNNSSSKEDNSSSASSPSGNDTNNVNQAIPGKTPEEIRTEAEQAVMLALRGYDKIHAFARFLTKKDEQKLAGEHAAGKINLHMQLPLGRSGSNISLQEFVRISNAGIDENITVSEKFKTEITPPLVRIAIKRGWGLSDEMTVLALLTEDLGTKAGLLIGLNKAVNQILELSYGQMRNKAEAANKKAASEQSSQEHQSNNNQNNSSDWTEPSDDSWKEAPTA